MKNKKFLIILPLCLLFVFNGKKYEEALVNRLSLPVQVCVEGQDCGTSSQSSQMSAMNTSVEVQKIELSQGSEHTIKMLNSGEGCLLYTSPSPRDRG